MFFMWFVWFWKQKMNRAENSLHRTIGAKIRPIFPVQVLNLIVMNLRRLLNGFYFLKFQRFTFLPESHYPKEFEVLKQIGPDTLSDTDLKDAQRKGLKLYCEALDDPSFCWSPFGRIATFFAQKREFLSRYNEIYLLLFFFKILTLELLFLFFF